MTTEWRKYDGTDEQIAEIYNRNHDVLLRNAHGENLKSELFISDLNDFLKGVTHYLIAEPHPLADMIARQAKTGQPVWIRMPKEYYIENIYPHKVADISWLMLVDDVFIVETTKPDWSIPGAEYSFTPFED